jgi:hypothetical protein
MKNDSGGLRIATSLMALVLGWFAFATIFAEAFTPKAQNFLQDLALPDPKSYGPLGDRAGAVAPLRGDLLADIAMAQAAPALNLGKVQASPEMIAARERALTYAKQSLSLAPHSSSMWLLIGMLQNQVQTRDSVAEVLKMSYLTAPADMNLIPARLAIMSASVAIADVELSNLARGDIRLILTRRPDLKPSITNAYRRGSASGKAYIDEVVRSLDPGFAASLR